MLTLLGLDLVVSDSGDDFIIASGFQNDDATLELFLHPPANVDAAQIQDLMQHDFSQDTDTEGDRVSGGAGNEFIIFGADDTVT